MRADVINYTHFIVYYYVNSIIWLVGWLISLFRNIVHLGHYSPSVYNNNILTHQKSKTGGESLDREMNEEKQWACTNIQLPGNILL